MNNHRNDLELIRKEFERLCPPGLPAFKFKGPLDPDKVQESSRKLSLLVIPQTGAPDSVWSEYSCYAVEAGQQFQLPGISLTGQWAVAFYHAPGRKQCGKGKFQRQVLQIAEKFTACDENKDYLLIPPNYPRPDGEDWGYIHLIKDYQNFCERRIAADLVHLIVGTYSHLNQMQAS